VNPLDFKINSTFLVRFRDCDLLGHMNNAVYLTIFEEARHTYYEKIGFRQPEPWSKTQQGFILASAKIDFKSPAFFGEELIVYSRISRFGNKSYDMEYLVTSAKDKRIVATGVCVLVAFDYKNNKSVSIYSDFKSKVLNIEGHVQEG
jgi:acyl-CoA thioester hydrolase